MVSTQPYPSSFANLTDDQGYILIYSNGQTIKFTKVASNRDLVWEGYYSQGLWANIGNYIEHVQNGGYIVTGRYQDFSGSGMLLLKLDEEGNKLWKTTFNDPTTAGFSLGFAVHQTNDNGYIITGFTHINYYEPTRNTDVFIVKTDSTGTEQ
ncbi:MAG: hypothetical protein ACI94Y_004189 [Maribacter sp.]|jgi:hypothetical protein